MKTQRITLPINDLSTRVGGVGIIKYALAQTPGVVHVYVNPAIEMAYIEFDPALCDPDSLVNVIEHTGSHTGKPVLR